jgi:hypothetical protein
MPVIITRGNNVFGPHQYPEKVIPKFIRRLLNGMPCCIHGDGSNSRHYIYVGDVAAAFDTIMHKGVIGDTYNIGCEIEHTNLQVAEMLVKALNPHVADPKEYIEFVQDRAFNDVRYYISSAKLHSLGCASRLKLFSLLLPCVPSVAVAALAVHACLPTTADIPLFLYHSHLSPSRLNAAGVQRSILRLGCGQQSIGTRRWARTGGRWEQTLPWLRTPPLRQACL